MMNRFEHGRVAATSTWKVKRVRINAHKRSLDASKR